MALRYAPLYARHARRVADAQRAAGLYKERNMIDDIVGGGRVFSATATWALEYGIVTAASMEARGYGVGRRTRYSPYAFKHADIVLTATSLLLLAVIITAGAGGSFDFTFYPRIVAPPATALTSAAYTAYGILSFLPAILTIIEDVRWKYLMQKFKFHISGRRYSRSVKRVTFSVSEGEFVAVCGATGSGKSTLLFPLKARGRADGQNDR